MARQPKEKTSPDEEIEEIIRKVADRLAAARKARGLTQSELGDLADLSQQRIFELEQGTANVTVRTLAKMAKVLDIDLHSLFIESGKSTTGQLAVAINRLIQVLDERGAEEQIFRAEIQAIVDRAKGAAVCTSLTETKDAEDGDHQPPISPETN
jgi:transcriptional regulator with XRE-family HTH domain